LMHRRPTSAGGRAADACPAGLRAPMPAGSGRYVAGLQIAKPQGSQCAGHPSQHTNATVLQTRGRCGNGQ
jgi:hypothetical protein